ncbi:helix-turn-helix domain-containing protein [Nonomuraea wenchangensis]|uniref:helix-turn-helix domain-containing protein n=1 Tax=Nonomuraea wenchangensis TaxID=568860 RepID=UPI00332C9134
MLEVLDFAPADLTPAQRLVLVVIAERAYDDTREAWPGGSEKWGLETIARRTGLKVDSVRKAIQQMARKGVEVRVPIKVGADGRPVYAHEGQQTTFRIPRFSHRADQDSPSKSEEGGSASAHSSQEGGPRSQEGGSPSTPIPHTPEYPSDKNTDAEVILLFGSEEKAEAKSPKKRTRAKKVAPVDNPDFVAFYSAMPRKQDPDAAARAWADVVASGVPAKDLTFAAEGYRDDPGRGGIRQYIKTPRNFLVDGRYKQYLPNHKPEDEDDDMHNTERAAYRDYD